MSKQISLLARKIGWVRLASLSTGLLGLIFVGWASWIPAKAQLAQLLLERAWVQSQETGAPVKAWSWADTWPVAKITIPSLNFEAIILKEAGGEGLAFGPVLLNQSARLGNNGLSVISAHRDTHFEPLADVKAGTVVYVQPLNGPSLAYRIDQLRIAPWNESGLTNHSEKPTLALTSCWPFDSITPGPLRFIAEASLIKPNAPTPL